MHASVTTQYLRRLAAKARAIYMPTPVGPWKVSRARLLRRLRYLDGTWFEVRVDDDILTIVK